MMLQDMPTELRFVKSGSCDWEKLATRYLGFVECTVTIPDDCYLPPLPYRTPEKLLFPAGSFHGIWATCELGLLSRVAGSVTDIGKSVWFKGEPIFREYVEHLYAFRDKDNPRYDEAMANVAKLLLVSLYGKFGMDEEREKIWFFPGDDDLTSHRLVPIADAIHGAFIEKVTTSQSYVIPHIAAWVTALARAYLWTLLWDILQRGGRIWYCDTDSGVTDLDVASSNKLGALKEVCKIKRAIFAAPKLYFLALADGSEYVKMKGFGGGFGQGKLTEKEFLRVVKAREKIPIKTMTKLREGIKSKERFPRMKTIEKGIHGLDTKRILLPDGNTRALIAPQEIGSHG